MQILFVCTGNICRSPFAELLLKHYLKDTPIRVESAGTRGLTEHEIHRSSARILSKLQITSRHFRSRRLTKSMLEAADLVLCFEHVQSRQITELLPGASLKTFLLPEFATLAEAGQAAGLMRGQSLSERLRVVRDVAPQLRMNLEVAPEVSDPNGQDFAVFHRVATEINDSLIKILTSVSPKGQ